MEGQEKSEDIKKLTIRGVCKSTQEKCKLCVRYLEYADFTGCKYALSGGPGHISFKKQQKWRLFHFNMDFIDQQKIRSLTLSQADY